MKTLLPLFVVLFAFSIHGAQLRGQDFPSSADDFATVHLFFLNGMFPESHQAGADQRVLSHDPSAAPRRSEVARIFLNDKFVGHAMFGHVDVKPTLNLPAGDYQIRVESDDYQHYEQALTVLRHASVQWLVVELKPASQGKGPATPLRGNPTP